MKIEKKCIHEFFQAIIDGKKTFEVRLADWECRPGDILVLREWDPNGKRYTGRTLEKEVTYVVKTKNIEFFSKKDVDRYGLQVIALK